MTALDKAYDNFAREHDVRRRLRGPKHVAALLEAAAVPPGKVDAEFWRQVRAEWLWGVSPEPFDDAHSRRVNAEYRRLCHRRGVTP